LLLLTAGQIAAATMQHFLEHREQFVHFAFDDRGLLAGFGGHAHQQIFFHRQQLEDTAMFRHQTDAARGNLVSRQTGHIIPLKQDFALTRLYYADDWS